MINHQTLRRFGRSLIQWQTPALLLAIALALPQLSRAADTATGTIQGRVMNADSGNYLNNVRVTVEGTNIEAFTDSYGNYRLTNVPAGEAKVDAFYTGLETQTSSVTVPSGQAATQDFNLSANAQAANGEVVKLDEFVVQAQKETDQKSIAINEQRFAPNIKTVVATDQFGEITEGNVGEFVKFLPGVSVNYTASDVRSINLGGVGSSYTSIMMDGYRVASADSGTSAYSASGGGTRTIELEQISINNAARIEINQARTPDLPADALGGSVNMISKSAFEYSHPELDYDVFVNMSNAYDKFGATPGFGNDATSHKVLPGFDLTYADPVSSKFGITFSAIDSNMANPQYRSNPVWAENGTLAAVTGVPSGVSLVTNPFLEKYTVQDGPKVTHRKAFDVTADWKISDDNILTFRVQDNFYANFFGNRNVNFDTGAVYPASYGPTFTNGAVGKGNVTFGSSFRKKFGVTYNLGTEFKHNGPVWALDAGVNFSHASAHYQDAQGGYFSAITYTMAGATVDYTGYNGINPTGFTVYNSKSSTSVLGNAVDPFNVLATDGGTNVYKITKVEDNPVDAEDVLRTAQASAKRTFDLALPTSIKVGAQLQQETRDIVSYKYDWTVNSAIQYANATTVDSYAQPLPYVSNVPTWPSNSAVYNEYVQNPGNFTASSSNAANAALGSLYFQELISAAYLMGDTKAFQNRLEIVYGIRLEKTSDKGAGPLAVKSGSVTTYTTRGATADNSYSGGYPSINISYKITDNLIGRVSYNRAIGRPDIGNIVENISLPDSGATQTPITISNPKLAPEQADDFNASLEYYFSHVGEVQAGVFRKDFSNFWASNTLGGQPAIDMLTQQGLPLAEAQDYITTDGDTVKTTTNAGTARETGVLLAYQQALTFLPGWANGFQVFGNVTAMHLESNAISPDFSAYVSRIANWGISYDNRRFSAQLNWNYRGRERDSATSVTDTTGVATVANPITTSYYTYFKPHLEMDANAEYHLTKNVGIFMNARNLFNTPWDEMQYSGDTPGYAQLLRRERFGTEYTFGIKGTF